MWDKFIIAFIYYIIIDGIMISAFMGNHFAKMIKNIQKGDPMKVRIIPTILSFIVLAFGVTYFVLDRVRDTHIIQDSLKYGLIFGFVVYATYDLVNYATIKDYTLQTTIIDITWGSFLAFLVTVLTKYTLQYIRKIRS